MITDKEKRDYYAKKAKIERGLSDKQINFFLDNCPRPELLPIYCFYIKKAKLSMQEAVKIVKEEFCQQ